ncbi:RAxF-45 family protein [Pseudalkalibacillus sp. R45]
MLTGLFRILDWLTVEVRSITHDFAFDGRSMSIFPNTKMINT